MSSATTHKAARKPEINDDPTMLISRGVRARPLFNPEILQRAIRQSFVTRSNSVDVLSELDHLGVAFLSFREQIDTAGPLGKAVMVIISAIAELERSMIIERVRAGMPGPSSI
jgi:hypothetical protein